MKQFVTMLGMAATVAAEACLYCRRMDKNSGAMVSYSYCKQSESCVKNVWNYVTRTCNEDWQLGGSLTFDYCETVEVDCPSYESAEDQYQVYQNTTWNLGAN